MNSGANLEKVSTGVDVAFSMADGGLPAVVRDQVVDKVGGKVIDKAKSALQAKK